MSRAMTRGISSTLLAFALLTGGTGAASAARPAPAGVAASLPALERVNALAAPRPMDDFELVDQTGAKRRLSSLRGQPVLLFFGFASCHDVCPAALAALKSLHQAEGGRYRAARVVMVSVDGERDTPAVLKKFLAPVSPDFIGLTGDPAAVTRIAAGFSTLFFKEPKDQKGHYNVAHSGQIYIVDKQGRLRGAFADAPLASMTGVTQLLLGEKG
jgi:protein SCO1